MPTADCDGTRLYYEEAGAGDPPFVFVHGWSCDHTYFAPQAGHFASGHRVISVDLRGHGQSDKPQGDKPNADCYTIANLADDVAWVCRELRLEHPVVVGHSMGGAVTLELAARHPDLPAAIVLVDAAPVVATPEVTAALADLVDAIGTPDHISARRQFIDGFLFIDTDDPVRRAEIVDAMAAAPQHVAVACMKAIGDWDGERAARGCKVPALHIGAKNPSNDPAVLRSLNPLIQTAQVAGAGHFAQLEVPDQVNAMIERFVKTSLTTSPLRQPGPTPRP
ncbi:MAG TPA: alpha/beta hydrolase [Acidimicrobiales bacterium]